MLNGLYLNIKVFWLNTCKQRLEVSGFRCQVSVFEWQMIDMLCISDCEVRKAFSEMSPYQLTPETSSMWATNMGQGRYVK